MLFEKLFQQVVHDDLELFITLNLLEVLVQDTLERHLTQLRKSLIIIILTNGKVNKVATYASF